MKKLRTLTLILIIISQSIKSQDYIDLNFGRSLYDFGKKAIIENDSTLILFGWGEGSTFILFKINSYGDTIYTKYIDLPYYSLGADILECTNGDLILIGDGGGIVRINEEGNILWSINNDTITQSAGVIINDTCFAIAGQRLVFSHITEIPDYGPDSVFYDDVYICLYNSSGTLIKDLTYSFVNNDTERSHDIILNSSNDLMILGFSYYNGLPNEFLLVADKDLNIKLDTIYEYPGIYIGNQILENSNGKFIVCGYKYVNSDPDFDLIIQEIENNGNINWEKTFDLQGYEYGNSILEEGEYYYITGQTRNKRDAINLYEESILLKFDKFGDTVYSKVYELPDWQISSDIQKLNDTTLVLFGSTKYNTSGNSDFHLIFCDKRDGYSNLQLTNIKTWELDAINVFPIPAHDEIHISGNGIEKLSIIDYNGKIIKQININNQNLTISITDLNYGLYILQFETKLGVFNKKLIKQ